MYITLLNRNYELVFKFRQENIYNHQRRIPHAKKNAELIVKGVKKYGPAVGGFALENKNEIVRVLGAIGLRKRLKKSTGIESKPKKSKLMNRHPRKKQYQYYLTEVVPALNTRNRDEWFQHKLEVEQYIQQIKFEQAQGIIIKKTDS